jgi:hypothetical protein
MPNIWLSHGKFVDGRIVKKDDVDWVHMEVFENETLYSVLIKIYCREPDSSIAFLTRRYVGQGNQIEMTPKQLYWRTRIDSLGVDPCVRIVSYFTAFQYRVFGKDESINHKME